MSKITTSRYVEIKYQEFKALMDNMKFDEIPIDGTFEKVWKFDIKNTNQQIRVFSTISVHDDVSRRSGSDSIKCVIYDTKENKILKLSKRVKRTYHALVNVRERCRELFKHVVANKCSCGGVLIERKSKTNHVFMGCSNFPKCKNNKNIVPSQLKLKM